MLEGLHGVFIEAESQATYHSNDVARAVPANDRFENDCSLISCLSRFFRILRLDTVDDRGRCNSATYTEHAAAETAAFTWANAGTFAFPDATTLTGSNSTADAWPRGRWTGNSERVADVQEVDLG